MNIAIFASSLVSAYWNGAATYYRGIVRALAQRGHQVTFYESDAYHRQEHRDIPDPDWARVVVYSHDGTDDVRRCLDRAAGDDLIIKASGNGVFDELLEEAVVSLKTPRNLVAFWDVDAPATLARLKANPADPFAPLILKFDLILTYGGGPPVVNAYRSLGARSCVPIYNAVDPRTHHPAEPDPRFAADLALLANRLPDREARIDEFFMKTAAELPLKRFVLGGSGWDGKPLPPNVRTAGHVYTKDHNAFNSSSLAVLNVNRDSMASMGYSPATRVFEAAGAGACVITDAFTGVETFLEPGHEILVARSGQAVAAAVDALSPARAREIGRAALRRVLAEHTYAHRVAVLEEVLANARGSQMRVRPSAVAEPLIARAE